ncbi:MAG TPA: hypothetical protein PKW15_01225, partial [Alphaproteobacteria bacterium]|nr:hypothetical protein [Alphaproteobacteria bacterium]
MSRKTLLTAVAAVAILATGAAAHAEVNSTTVTTTTYVQPVPLDGVTMINFSAFDLNKDGVYTKDEVGERLFRVF